MPKGQLSAASCLTRSRSPGTLTHPGTDVGRGLRKRHSSHFIGRPECQPMAVKGEEAQRGQVFSSHSRGSTPHCPANGAEDRWRSSSEACPCRRERVGRGLPHLVRHEADLCAFRTLRHRPNHPRKKRLRVCRRPAIWRHQLPERRARRKTNSRLHGRDSLDPLQPGAAPFAKKWGVSPLSAECSLGLGYLQTAPHYPR